MAKRLLVNVDKCTECRTCELECSFAHFSAYNSNKAGVRIVSRWPEPAAARVCRQCEGPACLAACPVDALLHTADGAVKVLYDECTGCGSCVEACPYDGVWLDPLAGVAVKCDTCAGRYACVAACATGAISVEA